MKIADIKIGKRHRKDAGDIQGLADSIKTIGLLHPIVVDMNKNLIVGWRRIEAYKLLGKDEIPHREVRNLNELLPLLTAERDENVMRKDFSRSEAVAMGESIEKFIEKPAAEKREKSGTNQYTEPSGKLPEGSKGDSRDKVGAAVGMSGKTYEKAKAVVSAAKENPKKFETVRQEMDKTGNVDKAFKIVKRIDDTDKLPFEPQAFNIWNFTDRNPAFGIEYPGNIPGDIIQNLLWLYTEKKDLVVDPFSGGGVTHDVCQWWSKKMWPVRCVSLDAIPSRPEIKQNDITDGFPASARNAKLVFLDPPYWKQKRGDYKGGDNLADMPLDEFHRKLVGIVGASADILVSGGYVALIIGATRDQKRFDHAAYLMKHVEMKLVERIIVPYSSQQAMGYHITSAKNGKLLLNRYRDLLVWQK